MKLYDPVRHQRIVDALDRYRDRDDPTFRRLCAADEALEEQWERETPEGQAHAQHEARIVAVLAPMGPLEALRLAILLKGRNPTDTEAAAIALLDDEEAD